jgi:hypothetical protein
MRLPSLSEEQQRMVLETAQPLPRQLREAFYSAVAAYFRGRDDVGDGELYRVLRSLQRECLSYPDIG